MMQDVGQLVSRYAHGSSGLLSTGADVEDSAVRKVTGKDHGFSMARRSETFTTVNRDLQRDSSSSFNVSVVLTQGMTWALTMADNKIYGIEKKE